MQEVVTQCKKLTKKNKEQLSGLMDQDRSKGLKALSRERRERLQAYQHLFYLLQVRAVTQVSPRRRCDTELCSSRPSPSTWLG